MESFYDDPMSPVNKDKTAKAEGSLFGELLRHRYLLWSFINRDLKMRYGASFMGFFWSVINPLLQIAIYTVVFGYFLAVNVGGSAGAKNYGIFLFSGMLPWIAFSEAVVRSSTVILENRDMVQQVRFPKILLPTHVVLASFLHELIAMCIFIVLLIILGQAPEWYLVGILFIFPLQLFFTLGVCLIVSSFAVFYKDVRELAQAFLMLWFFATPIVYPMHQVPDFLHPFFNINPVAPLINIYRTVLLGDVMPDMWGFIYFACFSLTVFLIGVRTFSKLSRDFPDLL